MAIWYIGDGGNNANSGLSYALRKATFANFRSSIAAGDVIVFCASAAGEGSTWVCSERMVLVGGSAGNWVTYAVYPGHYVQFEASGSSEASYPFEEATLDCRNISYFRIEPGAGFLEMGDASGWDPTGADHGVFNYSNRRQFNFISCSNFELIGTGTGNLTTTDSNFKVHGGRGWVANFFDVNTNTYRVSGVDWSKHGSNNIEELGTDDGYDLVVFGGYNCLIEYCTFQLGGHVGPRYTGRYQIVRNCWMDGDWDGVTANADAGRGAPIERSGQRCAGSYSGALTDENETASPWGPVMYENNIFNKAGSAGDNHDNNASECLTYHMIIRGNYIWDCCDAVFKASGFPEVHDVGRLKIYNNTMYRNGRVLDLRHTGVLDTAYVQCDLFNNICDEQMGAYFQGASPTIKQIRRHANNSEGAEGYPNEWKGGRYANNIFVMSSSNPEGSTFTIQLRTFGAGTYVEYNVATVEAAYPDNWFDNITLTAPTYAGNPGGGQRTIAAFAPNGGIESGGAAPHAYANGARTNSTQLVVESGQAYNFRYAWGMSSFGVEGDYIQIDGGDPVQISTISYSADTITLSEARTWSDGAEVYFCTTEDDGVNFTIWSDIGAGQGMEIAPDPYEPVFTPVVRCFK
jgi:hypothetical protein